MDPMFLPDVEGNRQAGPYKDAIDLMKGVGSEYPQIWHMLAFRNEAAQHLSRFIKKSCERHRLCCPTSGSRLLPIRPTKMIARFD